MTGGVCKEFLLFLVSALKEGPLVPSFLLLGMLLCGWRGEDIPVGKAAWLPGTLRDPAGRQVGGLGVWSGGQVGGGGGMDPLGVPLTVVELSDTQDACARG